MTGTASGRAPVRAGAGTFAGLFLITLSTLMFEIALTRIFSVSTWYHFAFVAISLALFGLTAGALFVHLRPDRFRDADVKRHLWRYSLLFAGTLALSIVTQLAIPFSPELNLAGAWSVLLTCVTVSIPFVCSGIVVCLALTRFPAQVNRLYAVDLIGAAVGCVLLLALFSFFDGPSLVVGIGAIAGGGALLFALDAGSRRGTAVAAAAVVALGGFAALNAELSARGHALLRVIWVKGSADPQHGYEKWNAFSRITVDRDPDDRGPPSGVGFSPRLPASASVEQLDLVIDGNASTVLTGFRGNPRETDFLRYDISNLAHHLRRDADAFVIGVGGGRDVLSALEFGARSVTGVEINGNILHVLNDRYGAFTGHLDRDPRVRFVEDEARSYLTRTDARYDVIQISLIDTWAASSAGAYALTENSLYTTDAWKVFFDRLQPGGILSLSRWYMTPESPVPLETYRAVALASQALTNRGASRPRDHLLAYRTPVRAGEASASTLLVSPEPFSLADRETLRRATERLGFSPVLTPDFAADRRFAALAAPGGPGPALTDFSEDVSPPTDDRPFFFQMANLSTLLSGDGFSSSPALRPVLVLGLLALIVLGLTIGCILLPLLLVTDRSAHRGTAPFYAFFAAIGLGFLFIEVSQLQRLTVFLGHPTYALSVVLFSLLVFAGIGSMVSERIARLERPATLLLPLGALVAVVALMGIVTPAAIDLMEGSTTPLRIATAVALLAPLGLVMGMPLAIGLRAASSRPAAPTAFLWGINGATSVCASVFAVVLAVFFGISSAYWAGAAAYVVAAVSLAVVVRRERVERVGAIDSRPIADLRS